MTNEEAWVHYQREAIDHVLQQGREWKQFKEAARIMRLIPHKYAATYLQKLSSRREDTLKLLKDVMFRAHIYQYEDILAYLRYWKKEH